MTDYISVLRRRKFLIAVMTLAGLALALVHSTAIATPTYVSKALVEVRPITDTLTDVRPDQVINMGTQRELALSNDVASLAAESLKWKGELSDLKRKVSVAVRGSTQILEVSCRDKQRLGAQECANSFANSYLEFKKKDASDASANAKRRVEANLAPIQARVNEVLIRLATAPENSPAQAEAQALLGNLEAQAEPYHAKLATLNALDVDNPGSIVSPATKPGSAASPKPKTNGIMGAFFGFFVGLLVAFARDRMDGRLRGRADLEEHLRAPVLATVPRTRRTGRGAPTLVTVQHPHSPASEAYRSLRTRVMVMADRHGMKTFMVASPSGEDGKTAIAANLAVSLAQVGKRVVLLSADLRRSQVHTYFGLDNERGLSNVLAGEMPPWEAVQEPAGLERLWVFGSGPTPAAPGELLQSDLMRELLAERRKVADFVIIEAPAALDASDCLALAPMVDGILVVADAKYTDRLEVAMVRDQFEQVGGHVVGAVLSNASTAR